MIDWSQLITKEMKNAQADAQALTAAKVELTSRNALAASQIKRIQDRVETLGYGIEAGEATPEEKAEADSLAATLSAWKSYKYQLGKVTAQATWHQAPAWPGQPNIPEIAASPALARAE